VAIDPEVAPVWRRVCASAIDVAIQAGGGMAVLVFLSSPRRSAIQRVSGIVVLRASS
jgi:hypothetical protein